MKTAFAGKNFYEIGAYLGKGHCGDSLYEHYNSAVAFALDLYKVPLGAIESTAMNAYSCSLFNVHLLGAQIGDLFVLCCGDGDELLHLAVRDNDGDVFAVMWAGVILQKIDTLLQELYLLLGGVYKDEVVYCRNHLPCLYSVASFDNRLFHWHEAFDAFAVEILFGDEFPAVGGAHGKPDNWALFLHGVSMCVGNGGVASWA